MNVLKTVSLCIKKVSPYACVPRRPSYGVYISQLIRFARVCSHVDDFNARNKCLTAKLLKHGYRYHKLRKAFSKFYHRHYELISHLCFFIALRCDLCVCRDHSLTS